jgi:hypothetical protein
MTRFAATQFIFIVVASQIDRAMTTFRTSLPGSFARSPGLTPAAQRSIHREG